MGVYLLYFDEADMRSRMGQKYVGTLLCLEEDLLAFDVMLILELEERFAHEILAAKDRRFIQDPSLKWTRRLIAQVLTDNASAGKLTYKLTEILMAVSWLALRDE